MNKNRRERAKYYRGVLREAKDGIEMLREEEDECRDNMPENLCESERYQHSEECSEAMDSAIASIEEAIEYIDTII